MLFQIPELLPLETLHTIQKNLSQVQLIDGKKTAGWHARLVKENEQALEADQVAQEIKTLVTQALLNHPLFQIAVRPQVIHSLLISHYHNGMAYGRHTDNAQMNGQRTDVSFTVFLNSPEEYVGGELVIEGADSEQAYKLDAGMAIVYPSTFLHRVEPVTTGDRWVAIGWVQSRIRDAAKREILFELETVQRSLFNREGKTDEFDLLTKSMTNLLRRWLDT